MKTARYIFYRIYSAPQIIPTMRKLYTDYRDVLKNRWKFASFYLIPFLILHPYLAGRGLAAENDKNVWLFMPLAVFVALVGTPETLRIYNDISGPTTYKSVPIHVILAVSSLALHIIPLLLINTDKFLLQRSVTDPQAIMASSVVLTLVFSVYLFLGEYPYSSDPVSMMSLMGAFLIVRRATSLRENNPMIVNYSVKFAAFVGLLVLLGPFFAKRFLGKMLDNDDKDPQNGDCLRAPHPTRESHYDFIIDVRTENERRLLGAHARSLHLPVQGITKDKIISLVGAAESRIRILAYCNTATRAKEAAQLIRSYGFPYTFYHPGTWDTIES